MSKNMITDDACFSCYSTTVIPTYKRPPLLSQGRWFSPCTPASSTTKTARHDIAEILLKVALKHQKISQSIIAEGDCLLLTEYQLLSYDFSM